MDVRFPIGQLEIPENATTEDVKEWLGEIETYTTRLKEVVNGLTEEELAKKYREGSWTVHQLVHHITDSQLIMFQRLKLALTDEDIVVPPFDQDKWAVQPDIDLPIEISIQILDGLNKRIVALGKTLTNEDLKRFFTLKGSGDITVATKLKKLSWHQEHHLVHIQNALKN